MKSILMQVNSKDMDKKTFYIIIICMMWFFTGVGVTYELCDVRYNNELIDYQTKLINAYDQYNNGAEQLLDELDDRYNWIDAYDNYNYYTGRERIDSLLNR